MALISVNDNNFEEEVLKSDKVTVVDFWAQWCGPCRQFLPIIEEVSNELDGKVKFCKFNVDEGNSIPAKYNITGIPTIIIFKEGKIIAENSGAMMKASLINFINSNL